MKKTQAAKKTISPVIITIILVAIIIFAVVLAIFNNPFTNHQYGSYQIPTGYIDTIRDDKSAVDGADVTYYIYPDKVICETKSYLPASDTRDYTATRTVVIYEGATSVAETVNKAGKEVANERR